MKENDKICSASKNGTVDVRSLEKDLTEVMDE